MLIIYNCILNQRSTTHGSRKSHFSPRLGPIRLLDGLLRSIGAESFTFSQNSQLRLETSLININFI